MCRRIQLRNTEDCFNCDLFNGKLCKAQLFVLTTRSIFEVFMFIVLTRKWIIRMYYCMLDEKRFWESVANVVLNSASLWDRGYWQQAVKPDCHMDWWSGEGEINVGWGVSQPTLPCNGTNWSGNHSSQARLHTKALRWTNEVFSWAHGSDCTAKRVTGYHTCQCCLGIVLTCAKWFKGVGEDAMCNSNCPVSRYVPLN